MANEKMDTSSLESQKPQEKDEGCENVPPASLLGETCPATPTLNQNVKGKPRLAGLQSALTPILKYLNIGNKNASLSNVSNGPTKPNANFSVLSVENNNDHYACTVINENLPEITLLDLTNVPCDSEPSTPGFSKELKKSMQVLDVNLNSKLCPTMSPFSWLHDEVLPEITLLDDTCDTSVNLTRHASILLESVPRIPFSETGIPTNSAENNDVDKIPSLPLSSNTSLAPENEASSLETTHDCTSHKRPSLESSERLAAKALKLEISQSSLETISATFNGNLTHSVCSASGKSDSVGEDVKKVQLQVTQDISVSSTLDGSTQMIDETKPVTEAHPINITRDLSTSNASVQCGVSQSLGCNSNNVTCELEGEPGKTSPWEKQSCASDTIPGTEKPNTVVSLNNTFTTIQDNVALQPLTLQNQTMELSTSKSSPLVPENQNANVSTKQVSPESSFVSNDNSHSKYSQSDEIQNQTSEKNSLQKSSGSTIVAQASATSISLQNTFESKLNGIVPCEEKTTMDEKSQELQDRSSYNPANNETRAKPNSPEKSGEMIQATAVSDHKSAAPRESTFNVNVAAEENPASGTGELKDWLNNEHPLCESIIIHNIEGHKANASSLDSTLDFKPDCVVTSTPMSTIKSFNFTVEREEGQTTAAQKRLYGEGPRRPVAPVSSEVPSNIVCDRKTFLRQPAPKPNMLSLKPPCLLSKFKQASLLPKRPDLLTSGQPMIRQIEAPKKNTCQILQQTTEMPISYNLRSTAAAASALKPPVSGLRKAATNSMPSGIQRAGLGLKPPQAKSISALPSGSDKPAGGTIPLAKNTLPAKKHPLPKTDALPPAKKKKNDNQLPASKAEASASSSDTTSKAKTLKAPTYSQRTLPPNPLKPDSSIPSTSSDNTAACESTSRVRTIRPPATSLKALTTKPQCHVCSNCTSLEAQLQIKDEEIRHLKEELLKLNKLENKQNSNIV